MIEPVHSHNYKVVLTFEGLPNEEGFVCDFRAVKRIFKRVVLNSESEIDLDQIMEFPTAENMAQEIWKRLSPFFDLYSVEVAEKPNSWAVYHGPEHEPA